MKSKVDSIIRSAAWMVLFIISFNFLNSCTKANDNNKPGPNEIFIQGMAFVPSTITVTTGTTVTWSNRDAVNHTVTSDTGLFDSGQIPKDGTYTHTFTTAGTFPYHCTIHPTMTGTVVVQWARQEGLTQHLQSWQKCGNSPAPGFRLSTWLGESQKSIFTQPPLNPPRGTYW